MSNERVQLTKGRLDGLNLQPIKAGEELRFVEFTIDTVPGLRLLLEADAVRELHIALGMFLEAHGKINPVGREPMSDELSDELGEDNVHHRMIVAKMRESTPLNPLTIEWPFTTLAPWDLAWKAWQTARLIEPEQQTTYAPREPEAPMTSPFWDSFRYWWSPNGTSTMWLCRGVFKDASPHLTDNERDERFTAFWQTIVDAQPVKI